MAKRPVVTLRSETKGGIRRPVIHILMTDGRVAEFKERAIALPEAGDDGDGVYAVLINDKGEIFHTPDGAPAILAVPVMGLELNPDPDKWLSWKDMAKRAGVSLSTAKRMSGDGLLPKPQKLGRRRIGFRSIDVDEAVKKLARK